MAGAASTLEGAGFGVESGDIAVIHVDAPLLSVICTVCMRTVSPVRVLTWEGCDLETGDTQSSWELCSVAPSSKLKMWVGWWGTNKVAGKVLVSHFKVQPGFYPRGQKSCRPVHPWHPPLSLAWNRPG